MRPILFLLQRSLYNSATMRLLRQSLLDTDLVHLRAIAEFWEIQLTTSRQRDVALELSQAITDSAAVERAFSRLPEDQEAALSELLAAGGEMPQRVFTREWGDIRAMGPGRMARDQPWQDPVSPAEALWYRGFLFKSFEEGPDGAYEAVSIPLELKDHLPQPEPVQPSITLEPVTPPSAIFAQADLLLDDACTLLAYVHNEHPRLGPNRRWREQHIERLSSRLHSRNMARFRFLVHVASRAGWFVQKETGRLSLDADAVTAWFQRSPFDQRCTLTDAWRHDPTWNDLFHIPTLHPEDTGAWRNDPVLARQTILRHLRACTPASWYALERFVAAAKDIDPDFQRPDGDYDSWYIRDEETGAYLSGFESWDAVEGRLIRYVLTKPMAWLGLVDVGATDNGQSDTVFRLNQDGAAVLGLAGTPSSTPLPAARLQSGFRVSVPAARRYERFQLARVADWHRTGDRFLYRLTPSSLERARKESISIERVLEFLQEITEAPIPSQIERALKRWNSRGTEAVLESAVLLRLSEPELMEKVTASPRLARLIEDRIGPAAAVVRRQDWPRIVTELEKMGLLPAVRDLPD